MLLASLSYALTGLFAKLASIELSSIEVIFFRNTMGAAFIFYLMAKAPSKKPGGRPWLLLWRGVVGTLSLVAFFYNIAHINLGAAFSFQRTSPLFLALIAFFIFKERLSRVAIFGILLSFLGMLFVMQPSANSGLDFKNSCLGIFSGLSAAAALASVRSLGRFYSTNAIVLSFFGTGALLAFFGMSVAEFLDKGHWLLEYDFLFSSFLMPSAKTWIFLGIMGVFSLAYQIYVTKSYRVAKKTGLVAGVGYCDIIFTLLLGLIIGDFLPNIYALFGVILIVLGGLILTLFKA